MPIWLFVWLVVCGIILLGLLIHYGFLLLAGFSIRDNVVFKNKYERKIYIQRIKIEKIEKKCNNKIIACEDKIKFYKYRSIYEENLKILHEKSLDNATIISNDYFDYLQKIEKQRKRKVK